MLYTCLSHVLSVVFSTHTFTNCVRHVCLLAAIGGDKEIVVFSRRL